MNTLYNTIKGLCDSRGLSFRGLAREAGISATSISDLKTGRLISLSSTTLQKIADYFNVPIEHLLTAGLPENLRQKPVVEPWRMLSDKDLVNYFWPSSPQMDESDLAKLKDVADMMLQWKSGSTESLTETC